MSLINANDTASMLVSRMFEECRPNHRQYTPKLSGEKAKLEAQAQKARGLRRQRISDIEDEMALKRELELSL